MEKLGLWILTLGEQNMAYNFKKDLDFGTKKELEFLGYFGGKLTKGSGRKEDIILDDGRKLELKAERYYIFSDPPDYLVESYPNKRWKTKSLYMEFEGNDGKPKGPFRAEADGVDFYVHFFLDGVCYVFDTKKLCNWLREKGSTYKTFKCTNKMGNNEWWVNGWLVSSWDLKEQKVGRILSLFRPEDELKEPWEIEANGEKMFEKFFKK